MLKQTNLVLDVLALRADVSFSVSVDAEEYEWFAVDVSSSVDIPENAPILSCEYGTWFGILPE